MGAGSCRGFEYPVRCLPMAPRLLTDLLPPSLSGRHRSALEWFEQHAGEEVPWPRPLSDGTLLATRAKGIYKPAWSEFALSVRQTLDGPYPDRAVEQKQNGTWSYDYYQEGLDVDDRDLAFTNRGLISCLNQVIPVGVLIQTQPKPRVRYRVLGLALVSGYGDGYFSLEGFSDFVAKDIVKAKATDPRLAVAWGRADAIASAFEPRRVEDERRRALASIAVRQGQPGFRRTLLKAYEGRCAITNYDAAESLEAAHIVPYRGPVTNHPSNGLLLRADLHSLFDLGLVAVDTDPSAWSLVVSPEIRKSSYETYHGARVRRPLDPLFYPSTGALRQHREQAGF